MGARDRARHDASPSGKGLVIAGRNGPPIRVVLGCRPTATVATTNADRGRTLAVVRVSLGTFRAPATARWMNGGRQSAVPATSGGAQSLDRTRRLTTTVTNGGGPSRRLAVAVLPVNLTAPDRRLIFGPQGQGRPGLIGQSAVTMTPPPGYGLRPEPAESRLLPAGARSKTTEARPFLTGAGSRTTATRLLPAGAQPEIAELGLRPAGVLGPDLLPVSGLEPTAPIAGEGDRRSAAAISAVADGAPARPHRRWSLGLTVVLIGLIGGLWLGHSWLVDVEGRRSPIGGQAQGSGLAESVIVPEVGGPVVQPALTLDRPVGPTTVAETTTRGGVDSTMAAANHSPSLPSLPSLPSSPSAERAGSIRREDGRGGGGANGPAALPSDTLLPGGGGWPEGGPAGLTDPLSTAVKVTGLPRAGAGWLPVDEPVR